jgi:hypothetical protein
MRDEDGKKTRFEVLSHSHNNENVDILDNNLIGLQSNMFLLPYLLFLGLFNDVISTTKVK